MELSLSRRLDLARTRLQQLSEWARQAASPPDSIVSNSIEDLRFFIDEVRQVEVELRAQKDELQKIQAGPAGLNPVCMDLVKLTA